MPQIQELMGAPSFGGELGKALGGGVGQGISQGLQQSLASFNQQKKSRSALEGLKPLFKQAGIELSPEDEEMFVNSGIDPQIAANLAGNIYKQKSAQQAEQQKLTREREETTKKETEEQRDWENTFQTLEDKLPYVGAPIGKAFLKNIPWSKAAEEREAYDVAAFQLERYARNAHTKGTLSKGVYESLLSKLPSSKLSQAQNRGRIKEWKKVLVKKGDLPKDFNLGEKESKSSESSQEKGPIAVNPQTGEKLILRGGQWQPLQ